MTAVRNRRGGSYASHERSYPHRSSRIGLATALLSLLATAACSAASRPPATPAPTIPAAPALNSDSARRGYTAADVRFMQRMIAHHTQALAMTSLVPARSQRKDIQLLAERIEISQRDEITLMRNWLTSRGETISASDSSAMPAMPAMLPGMLTPNDLAQLTRATGPEFDRLFLQFMIRHHEGAIQMVAGLLGTTGAAQESEIFRFASDVDADQRAEIRRMSEFLSAPSGAARDP